MVRKFTASSRLATVRVRGATMQANVRTSVTSASISLSQDSPTTINLTVDDPVLDLMAAGLFTRGSAIDYAGLEMQVRTVAVDDSDVGPTISVTGRSEAWVRLKTQIGSHVWKNTTPAAVVRALGHAVGLTVVAQTSAKRRQITRGKHESSQAMIERYAQALNFLTFESEGTLYFGTAAWLTKQATPRTLVWNRLTRKATGTGADGLVGLPSFVRAEDSPRGAAELTAQFIGDSADGWRTGHVIDVDGVPTLNGAYLVNTVDIPLDEMSPVTVRAAIPQSLKTTDGDVPPTVEARAGNAVSAALLDYGLPPVTPLVDAALAFVVGQTPDLAGTTPVQPFTGAEMVTWCAGRAGVTMAGEPDQMLTYCQRKNAEILIETGAMLRGALLFTPDMVGIALGGGRVVIPTGRSYTIVSAASIDWTAAAQAPGLRYGR